ncbi:MAG TPA: outer membrane lipoprotein carrier protein LolA [Bacilli bacterium]|nr:outer membrane lipoprotein carrier protein LolA [Bacilli bacterium]
MKNKLFIIIVVSLLFLTGCGNKSENDIYKKFKNKIENTKSYYLTGTLELMSNETLYTYDVKVSYEKKDKFKVSLKNQTNGHEQIVLRNNEGVYVITPSLNKSFKFQSEWPYNNSQAYLLQTILEDLENDKDRKFEKKGDKYIFTSKVNYINNNDLSNQKVYLNKDYEIEKVEVMDTNNNIKITMKFNDIDFKSNFNDNYFNLDTNVMEEIKTENTSKIDDIIYPMYIPTNTNLKNQDTIKTENGQRVILTFDGDGAFMFIQETVLPSKEIDVIPVNGEPVIIGDSVGALTDYSINWYSNGKEYYVVSSVLKDKELLEVAKSVSSVPVIK